MTMQNDSMSTVQEGNSTSSGRPYPHPAQQVVMWVVPLLNITLNLLVFVVVPRIKTLRVSTTVGMFSLAVTDFSVGVICLINTIYNTYSGFQLQTNHPLCTIVSYVGSLFGPVSVIMLTYLNMDRLMAFLYPLRYRLTRKQAIIINVVIWLFVMIMLVPNIIGNTGYYYYEQAYLCLPIGREPIAYKELVNLLLFFILAIINMVSFCGSFYLIHSRHKRPSARSTPLRVHYGGQVTDNPDSQWSRDRRTLKVLAIMTFGFYIAWFPYAITMGFPKIITGYTLHPVTDFITTWLAASNSFWNPIIYLLTLRPFIMALTQLCKNSLCGRYMFKRTGRSAERPAVSPNRGAMDNNTGDCTRAAPGPGVEDCTRI